MDAAITSQQHYERPRVSDYGTLAELTADAGMLLGVGLAGLSAPLNPPETPGGPGGPGGGGGEGAVAGSFQVPPVGGEGGGVGEAAPGQGGPGESVPAGAESQGGAGGGGGGEGGGGPVETGGGAGSLPFTGFAAAGVAGIGALLGGAGAALRRVVKRRSNRR
jgi:hypothetical protein